MLEGLIGFFIIVMLVFIVGLLLWYVVVGVGGILGLIYNTEVTRILFCLGLLALSGWLMYAGWIGGTIHWAWAAFAGIPVAELALVFISKWKPLVVVFPLTQLAYGGWLMYAGWIGGTIHWAWSAFAGIPCLIGALVLWSVIINNE